MKTLLTLLCTCLVSLGAAAQNFSQDFVLHYLPSNMRIVKYVGEKTVDGLQVPADEKDLIDEPDGAEGPDGAK